MKKELVFYASSNGKQPFKLWLRKLRDFKAASKIQTALNRLSLGEHKLDIKSIHPKNLGLKELRVHEGGGYRVYYVELQSKLIILLLHGGKKSTQDRDIKKALSYWESYKERFSDE